MNNNVNKLICCQKCNNQTESGWRGAFCGLQSLVGLSEIYQFGVYTGQSIFKILHLIESSKIWGFDSFIGLPDNKEQSQPEWSEGGFNSCDHFKVNSVAECVDKTYKYIAEFNHFDVPIELIPGFYDSVLTDQLVIDKQMKPALYIDIDCDLYSSTKTALHWMCRNNLIVRGTMIGFDDWGGTPNFHLCLDGESKAFREIVLEFNLDVQLLFDSAGKYPHSHRVYILK